MLTSTKNLVAAEARIAELTGQLQLSNEARVAAEAKVATFEGSGEGSLAALLTRAETAEASVLDLTGKLTKASDDLKLATGQVDAFKAAIGEGDDAHFAFAHPEGGKPALSLTDAGKAALINPGVTAALAKTGHVQMPLKVDNEAFNNSKTTGSTGEGRTKTTWAKPF